MAAVTPVVGVIEEPVGGAGAIVFVLLGLLPAAAGTVADMIVLSWTAVYGCGQIYSTYTLDRAAPILITSLSINI